MCVQRPISFSAAVRPQAAGRRVPSWIIFIPTFGALLLGILSYQLPTRVTVPVGSLGDQLFVDSSEALDAGTDAAGQWYVDELSADGRSRWTRSRARVRFSQLGGGAAELTLRAQGWPDDVVASGSEQPVVTVRVGSRQPDTVVGEFRPVAAWQEYAVSIPSSTRTSADLVVELEASATFTNTRAYSDPRPKGIRVDQVMLSVARPSGFVPTGFLAVLALASGVLLMQLATRRLFDRVGLHTLFSAGLAVAGATLLALWRPWVAPLLPLLPVVGAAGLAISAGGHLHEWAHAFRVRVYGGEALAVGAIAGIVAAALLFAVTTVARMDLPTPPELRDPEQLLQLVPPLVVVALLAAAGPTVLPGTLRGLRRRLLTGKLAAVLLAITAVAILGWELLVLRDVPIVGHADYADNAVVARSLLRGEGWTVPYVTQFYELVAGGSTYRTQETWPLLQPVWMLPFMAIFGPTAFAARVPNLLFNLALLLLVYHIGATIWDRRVGLLAAILTLLSHFFFLLTLYSTTDLGFTVLSMASLWLVFQAWNASASEPSSLATHVRRGRSAGILHYLRDARPNRLWAAAGITSGLMVLQKPTGVIFGAGMFAWLLLQWWHARRSEDGFRLPWRGLALWMGLAALVVSPYIGRNLLLWGRLFFSTESYDAWILGYKGTRKDAWEEIYRVYLGDLPNRSWILRAGWDRTFQKFLTQVAAVRAYLLPPRASLLGVAATWLAIGGCLVLRPRQRQLVGLVVLVGALYVLFLTTYWHADEERYFLPFVPWLLLLAMGGLCAGFDRALTLRGGRWAGLAGGLAVLLLLAAAQPHLRRTDALLDPGSGSYWGRQWLPDLRAYAWLKANSDPDEVAMTRGPWQLSWEADRPSVMIPNAPLTSEDPEVSTILRIARYYGADYLVVNTNPVSGGEAGTALRPLSQGQAILGFTPVYTGTAELGRAPIRIYRFPADYGGVAPIAAEGPRP